MAYEMLVALDVQNDKIYSDYREAIKPIALLFGAKFTNDFKVSEVLLSENKEKINRVFTISFPSEKDKEGFFSDEKYLEVKKTYFEKSVGNIAILSTYEK